MVIVGLKTDIKWMNSIAEIPIIGGIFIALVIFVVPVLISFAFKAMIPSLDGEMVFTKTIMVMFPLWCLTMWFSKIKLYIFFIPAWIFFLVIVIIKLIKMLY